MFDYECGTCGSRGLIIQGVLGGGWRITCLNRHELLSDPATVYTITLTKKQEPDEG